MLDVHKRLYYLPNPRQVELEEAVASQKFSAICIGGAKASAKSHAWRMIAQRYARQLENFTVLFLRREYKPLIRNHLRFAKQEAKLLGGVYTSMKFAFPEMDSEIEYSHCQDPDDWNNYQGAQADLVIFEQLEQFEPTQFSEISTSAGRVPRDDWRGLIGASENPNGPHSAFVNTFFVDKNPNPVKFPDYDPSDCHFIEAGLNDNPHVDPRYVKNLARMSPEKRLMYRFGRRDIFPGQFFTGFNPSAHVKARVA